VDRRDELGRARTEIVNRVHQLLLKLIPGGAKRFLTRGQASSLLRTAPAPAGIVAQTRHHLARELIDELTAIDAKVRAANKQLRQLVTADGCSLTELNGIGPSGAARQLGDIGDIGRFPTAAHFASWNGTVPQSSAAAQFAEHGCGPLQPEGREPCREPAGNTRCGKQDPCGTVVPRLTNDEPADQPDDCGCGGDHPQKTGGAARGGHASLYVGLTRCGHVPDPRTEAADTPNATVATARTDYRDCHPGADQCAA
jgi:hypothetical protein